MRDFLRKFSLHTQIIFVNTILLLFSLIFYFVYIILIDGTKVYANNPTLFNILYWLIIIIVLMFSDTLLIEQLTFPAKEFIGYAKEFEKMNFNLISKEMTNSDFVKLANAFNDLQCKLNETIKKIQQKNNEISKLNDNLKNELVYKRDLVASISHDIKTPLTIIAATISAIQDGIFTEEETKQELENVLIEIDKTTKMLQDTINIYQLESEISEDKYEECSIINIVNSITDDLSKLITKYKHTLHLNLKTDIKVNANKDKLTLAIKNIILNAIVHSPENNNIYVNIIIKENTKSLEIINMGITISENDMKNIFKPFYRADKSRTKKDDFGNGLGLAIAKEIFNKHNFEVTVCNIENGVKFNITF